MEVPVLAAVAGGDHFADLVAEVNGRDVALQLALRRLYARIFLATGVPVCPGASEFRLTFPNVTRQTFLYADKSNLDVHFFSFACARRSGGSPVGSAVEHRN